MRERFDTVGVLRVEGDADAAGDAGFAVRQQKGFGEAGDERVGDLQRAGGFADIGHDHGEFVTAHPRHGVALANPSAQPLRDLLQQEVAGGVAEAIIDALESVKVDPQHGGTTFVSPGVAQGLTHAVPEQVAVGQVGQAVVVRQRP